MQNSTQDIDIDEYNKDWEDRWKVGNIPWDCGATHPALVQLIEEKKWPLPTSQGSKALVPGCGTGYEAIFLAKHGAPHLTVTGADLSPTAVEEAKKYLDTALADDPDKASLKSSINYQALDFFDFEVPEGGYQLAYDMRFFCALPPCMRAEWGRRYSKIISSGGELITLMFPMKPREGGPPFQVSMEAYREFLEPHFELKYYDDQCNAIKDWEGDEHIAVWRRR